MISALLVWNSRLGFQSLINIVLPAYLSSLVSCYPHIHKVFYYIISPAVDKYTGFFWFGIQDSFKTFHTAMKQHEQSNIKYKAILNNLQSSVNKLQMACQCTSFQPQSRDWLNAIPLLSTGTLFNNECVYMCSFLFWLLHMQVLIVSLWSYCQPTGPTSLLLFNTVHLSQHVTCIRRGFNIAGILS